MLDRVFAETFVRADLAGNPPPCYCRWKIHRVHERLSRRQQAVARKLAPMPMELGRSPAQRHSNLAASLQHAVVAPPPCPCPTSTMPRPTGATLAPIGRHARRRSIREVRPHAGSGRPARRNDPSGAKGGLVRLVDRTGIETNNQRILGCGCLARGRRRDCTGASTTSECRSAMI